MLSVTWGSVVFESPGGSSKKFKDLIISPSIIKEWNFNDTGMKHDPRIRIIDIEDYIRDVDTVILSQGMSNQLKVADETIKYLKDTGKEFFVLNSKEAVQKYNALCGLKGRKCIAFIHSMC